MKHQIAYAGKAKKANNQSNEVRNYRLTKYTQCVILYAHYFGGDSMPRTATMSTTTTINVRVDETVKRNVEVLFDSMGMNISTAVNIFLKQCLMEEALPFQPKVKRKVSLKNALSEARLQAKLNGVPDMSLDEINSIITEVRSEKRGH